MKNIITIIFIALLTYSLYAQVPGIGQVPLGMKYQAVARDAQGQPMNGSIGLRFTILQGSETGTPVFVEERAVNADNGLFVLTIGEVNNQDFSDIDWRLGDHFLKVERNDGGWVDLGTHQLLSVPYAVTAGNGKQKHPTVQDEYLITHGPNGNHNIVLNSFQDGNYGRVSVRDENGEERGRFFSWAGLDGAGNLDLMGENNSFNVRVGPLYSNANFGTVAVRDDSGVEKGNFFSNPIQGGAANIHLEGGNNNNLNVSIGATGGPNIDYGAIRVYDADGAERMLYYSAPANNGAGTINMRGANNNYNVTMGATGNDNHGRIWIYDGSGTKQAGLEVLDDGQGRMFADVKHFRMDHPKNPEKEIWYACIEGPEAAAYERGTAQLTNGEVRVDFSEHFELVVNPGTLTVTLTPLDANSKGLAVIEKTATGFIVKELNGGTGNYEFDWRVEGVRKGYEDFEVIRDKAEMERMLGIDTEEK